MEDGALSDEWLVAGIILTWGLALGIVGHLEHWWPQPERFQLHFELPLEQSTPMPVQRPRSWDI